MIYTPESLRESSWAARVISDSPESTRRLGGVLSGFLVPGTLVALYGELGTGKTEFVHGYVEALGGAGVKSPSFTLENIYRNGYAVYHFDLFRLQGPVDPEEIGLVDALGQGDGCVFVEWAEKMAWLPGERMDVAFSHRKEHERSLEIASYIPWFDGEGFTQAMEALGVRYEIY